MSSPPEALIGYSFGADMIPFAYNRLPASLRDHVVLIALLGLSKFVDFEISVRGWLGEPPSPDALPVLPQSNQNSAVIDPVLLWTAASSPMTGGRVKKPECIHLWRGSGCLRRGHETQNSEAQNQKQHSGAEAMRGPFAAGDPKPACRDDVRYIAGNQHSPAD